MRVCGGVHAPVSVGYRFRCVASYNLYNYISEPSFRMLVVWGTLSNVGHAATLEIVYLRSYSRFKMIKIANGDNWLAVGGPSSSSVGFRGTAAGRHVPLTDYSTFTVSEQCRSG
jgi:hypothetical protein